MLDQVERLSSRQYAVRPSARGYSVVTWDSLRTVAL